MFSEIPGLYPILDFSFLNREGLKWEDVLKTWEAYKEVIPFIQLRAKDLSETDYEKTYLKIKESTAFPIIINDFYELAIRLKAFGFHLGKEEYEALSPKEKDSLKENTCLRGTSSHSLKDLEELDTSLWHYTGFDLFFQPRLKRLHIRISTQIIKEAIKISPIPITCIGGINEMNLQEIFQYSSPSMITCIEAACKEESFYQLIKVFKTFQKR